MNLNNKKNIDTINQNNFDFKHSLASCNKVLEPNIEFIADIFIDK